MKHKGATQFHLTETYYNIIITAVSRLSQERNKIDIKKDHDQTYSLSVAQLK